MSLSRLSDSFSFETLLLLYCQRFEESQVGDSKDSWARATPRTYSYYACNGVIDSMGEKDKNLAAVVLLSQFRAYKIT
jgi:hypothetical protein